MDDEDLNDAEEARKIQTSAAFAGLGSTENDSAGTGSLMDLFRAQGESTGTRLLKKMGWKEGQGIGPKVRRAARLQVSSATDTSETFLFAPENVTMITFLRKTDRKGLGYEGSSGLTSLRSIGRAEASGDTDDDEEDTGDMPRRQRFSLAPQSKKTDAKSRGGIGIGVLNDTGSDDEDPYEIGPRISYNRVIGGDKKKSKKSSTTSVNPAVKTKPTFLSKKSTLARTTHGLRKCHDGRLPLDGFVFGQKPDSLTTDINSAGKYLPPKIPPDWVSSKQAKGPSKEDDANAYISTADAAKASKLDHKGRAALLGEKQLPGKSVFDFLSGAARDRLAAATGRTDLPQAKGEIPKEYALTEEERLQELMKQVPVLDKETAVAVISRGASGGAPYADDEAKRSRYRAYLELQAGFTKGLPTKPANMSNDEWLREFQEFFNCARIFKPMTGMMASRFTTSSTTSKLSAGSKADPGESHLVSRPAPKPQDPAEEAARLGMFGHMTRSVADFYPTRLLCKRFGVRAPAHVQPDQDTDAGMSKQPPTSQFDMYGDFASSRSMPLAIEMPGSSRDETSGKVPEPNTGSETSGTNMTIQNKPFIIDPNRNEALEGKRAGDELFKAIFGDDSDDE
jgi:G patch domain-containing protein 1